MLQLKDKNKVFIYLLLFIFLSTIFNFNFENYLRDKFVIKEILVSEDNYKNKFNSFLNKNIFKIDKIKILNNLQNYPELEKFKINKIYPDKLNIKLIETLPIAKIYKNNEIFLIGKNGRIFQKKNYNLKIPLIEGDPELKKTNYFLKLLEEADIDLKEIKKIIPYPSGRWDLLMIDGIVIKLPIYNVEDALMKSKLMYNNKEIQKSILDLRIKNRIIISNE